MEPIYLSIQQKETGSRIKSLLRESGYTVRDIQNAMGFENPQAVYKWTVSYTHLAREDWPVIFGIDGLEEALEAVKAGEMQGSILNDRVDQAKEMAKMAVELFEGEDFEQLHCHFRHFLCLIPVSYTHLDVYKRQGWACGKKSWKIF